MLNWPSKLPQEILDFQIDWRLRLKTDTIVSSVFVISEGDIVIESQEYSGTVTVVWLSGGTIPSVVTNTIVTAGGRTMQETVSIAIKKH